MDNQTQPPEQNEPSSLKLDSPKHTPGPWTLLERRVIAPLVRSRSGKQYELIAQARTEADARLIAAAPDMLDALRNVQKLISEAAMTGFNYKDGDWADRLFFSQQKTHAAIAKATGAA